jgi:hypothetical protein
MQNDTQVRPRRTRSRALLQHRTLAAAAAVAVAVLQLLPLLLAAAAAACAAHDGGGCTARRAEVDAETTAGLGSELGGHAMRTLQAGEDPQLSVRTDN